MATPENNGNGHVNGKTPDFTGTTFHELIAASPIVDVMSRTRPSDRVGSALPIVEAITLPQTTNGRVETNGAHTKNGSAEAPKVAEPASDRQTAEADRQRLMMLRGLAAAGSGLGQIDAMRGSGIPTPRAARLPRVS